MKFLVFDTETTGLPPTWKLNNLLNNQEKEWEYFLQKWPYLIQLTFVIYDTDNMIVEEVYDKYIQIPESIKNKLEKEIENNKLKLKNIEKNIKEDIFVDEKNIDIDKYKSLKNSTGYKGIKETNNGKFISIYKKKYIGTFETKKKAVLEYAKKEIKENEIKNIEKIVDKTKKTISVLQGNLNRWNSNEKITINQVNKDFNKAINKSDFIIAHNINFDFLMMIATARRSQNPTKYLKDLVELRLKNKNMCTMCIMKNIKKLKYSPSLTYSYSLLFDYEPKEEKLHDSLYDVIITLRIFVRIITGKDIYRPKDIHDKIYKKNSDSFKILKLIHDIIPKNISEKYPRDDIQPIYYKL